MGWTSQSIIVVPDLGIVVALTAATLHGSADVVTILYRWILPSVGLDKTIRKSLPRFSPALFFLAGGPFALIIIVHIWDQRGLWEDSES